MTNFSNPDNTFDPTIFQKQIDAQRNPQLQVRPPEVTEALPPKLVLTETERLMETKKKKQRIVFRLISFLRHLRLDEEAKPSEAGPTREQVLAKREQVAALLRENASAEVANGYLQARATTDVFDARQEVAAALRSAGLDHEADRFLAKRQAAESHDLAS